MAALLVSLAVMSVLMSAVLPVWRFQARREKEAELVFRGEQYARAVGLFARKNGGAFPPNLDVLVQGRYLRKKYKDPMVPDGEFQPLFAGANMPGQPQPGRGTAPGGVTAPGGGSRGGGGRIGQPSQTGGVSGGGFGGGGFGGASVNTGGGVAPGGSFQNNPGQMTGPGGLIGVVSKSKESSIMIYRGATRYSEWLFRYAGLQNQPGAVPGQGMPGMPRMGPDGRPMPTAPGMVPPRGGRGGRGGRGPGGFGPGGFGGPGGRGPGRGARPPG
jgi:type II secretory pathway pseudopilin PulG